MHWTSGWKLSQEEADLSYRAETTKTTSPQTFPHPGNPLISRGQICTPTNVPGVVTQCMPKDSNVLQENFNVKYVTNLGISPQYVIRRASSHQAHLKLENPKHNNFKQRPYTPIMMLIEVDLNCQILKNHSVYRWKYRKHKFLHPQVPKPIYLMINLAYHLQLHHKRNQYLCARLDMCADINLMPMAVYCLMFKDPGLKKHTPSNMEIETYTNDIVRIIGMCHFYLLHLESKQVKKVMFFVAKENGSILLSCRTTMELGLIKTHVWLNYLPPRASLLISTYDQPSETKAHKSIIHHMREKPTMVSIPEDNQLITRKEKIIERFPDVFEGIGKFPGKPYKIQLDPKVPPKQTPCRPVPIHLKEAFKTEIDKMLKAGVLKPVQEATQWINSFVLVEGTDQQGKTQIQDMFRPNKPEQSHHQGAVSLQNPWRYFTLTSQFNSDDCAWLQERLLAPGTRGGFLLSYHISYWIWKILLHRYAIWCNHCQRYVPEKTWSMLWTLTKS